MSTSFARTPGSTRPLAGMNGALARADQVRGIIDRQAKQPHRDATQGAGEADNLVQLSRFNTGTGVAGASPIDIPEWTPMEAPVEQFISSQEWDGYVTEVVGDRFRGVIYPLGASSADEELVEIPMVYVEEDVRAHVVEGAVFRLSTGRLKLRRTIMQGTRLYFRKAARLRKGPDMRSALKDLFADG